MCNLLWKGSNRSNQTEVHAAEVVKTRFGRAEIPL